MRPVRLYVAVVPLLPFTVPAFTLFIYMVYVICPSLSSVAERFIEAVVCVVVPLSVTVGTDGAVSSSFSSSVAGLRLR